MDARGPGGLQAFISSRLPAFKVERGWFASVPKMMRNQPNTRIVSANLDVLMALTAATMMRSLSNRRIMRPRPTCKHATRKGHLAAAGCFGLVGQTTCKSMPTLQDHLAAAGYFWLPWLPVWLLAQRAKPEREGWIGWWTTGGRGGGRRS